MRKFQFMGGDLDSEQGILQTGLVIETVRGHTPGTKSCVGLYDCSDRWKHVNYCESSIFVTRNHCQCSMYQHLDEFYHGVLPNEGRDAYWKGLSHSVKCIHLDTSTDHLYDPKIPFVPIVINTRDPKVEGKSILEEAETLWKECVTGGYLDEILPLLRKCKDRNTHIFNEGLSNLEAGRWKNDGMMSLPGILSATLKLSASARTWCGKMCVFLTGTLPRVVEVIPTEKTVAQ